MLPTVSATGWMVSVCEDLYPGYTFFAYDNYRLYKGVVFDGNQSDSLTLDVERVAVSDAQLTLRAKAWSNNQKGLRVNHYTADITLVKGPVAAPRLDTRNAQLTAAPNAESKVPYEDGTLFHGPCFQSIQQILRVSEKGLALRCVAPVVLAEIQGQFGVSSTNPFVDDVLYQAMLVWVRYSSGKGSLPSSARRYEQYELIKPGKEFFVLLEVVSSQTSAMVANITLHSEAGEIYGRMMEAEVTISDALNSLFLQNNVVDNTASNADDATLNQKIKTIG